MASATSEFVRCLESFGDAVGLNNQIRNYVYKTDIRDLKFFCADPYVPFEGGLPDYLHPEFEFAYPVKNAHIIIEDVTDKNAPILHYDANFLQDEPSKTILGDVKPSDGAQTEFLPFCAAVGNPRRIRLSTKADPLEVSDMGLDEVQEYNLSFSADEAHVCAKPPIPTPPEGFAATGEMNGHEESKAEGVVNPVTGETNDKKALGLQGEAFQKYLEEHGFSHSTTIDEKSAQLEMQLADDKAVIREFEDEPVSWTQFDARPTVMA
ncbi:unnamed protein product [Amoebophrya sp. A120]|nr:unnamed protein product [Amoebophrya sp. A120]|eukprot:GSA120T00008030001.1